MPCGKDLGKTTPRCVMLLVRHGESEPFFRVRMFCVLSTCCDLQWCCWASITFVEFPVSRPGRKPGVPTRYDALSRWANHGPFNVFQDLGGLLSA